MNLTKKLLLTAGFGLLAASLLLATIPGVKLLAHPPAMRSQYCTLWQAVFDASIARRASISADAIAAASRMSARDGQLELWETPMGSYWLPTGNKTILPILLAQQKRNIYGTADLGVRPGDIVLDCGAHVGTYTRKALASGARLVVAIEPSPLAIACLRRNLDADVRNGRVIIYEKGVWDRDGVLEFFTNGNGAAGDSFVNKTTGAGVEHIPVTSIDKLTQELKLPRVDFIKADVKGSTERMLVGAAGVLSRFRPRMALSTEEPPEDAKSIAALVQRLAPAYKLSCGPCLTASNQVSTDVMFFH